MSSLNLPGVMGRVGVGAGIGAIGGLATTGDGGNHIGNAIGGAALGAVGGAASSKLFRAGAGMAMRGAGANVTRGNVARALNSRGARVPSLAHQGGVFAPGARSAIPSSSPLAKAHVEASRGMASSAAAKQRALLNPASRPAAGMPKGIGAPKPYRPVGEIDWPKTGSLRGRRMTFFGKAAAAPGFLSGVMGQASGARMLGGAAIGAGLGYATKPEGESGIGRAIGGGALGAIGGALSGSAPAAAAAAQSNVGSPGVAARLGALARKIRKGPGEAAAKLRHGKADFVAVNAGMDPRGNAAMAVRGMADSNARRVAAADAHKPSILSRLRDRVSAGIGRSSKTVAAPAAAPAAAAAAPAAAAAAPAAAAAAPAAAAAGRAPARVIGQDAKVPAGLHDQLRYRARLGIKTQPGTGVGESGPTRLSKPKPGVGWGSPAAASDRLRAHADEKFSRSAAGAVTRHHGLGGTSAPIGPTIGG